MSRTWQLLCKGRGKVRKALIVPHASSRSPARRLSRPVTSNPAVVSAPYRRGAIGGCPSSASRVRNVRLAHSLRNACAGQSSESILKIWPGSRFTCLRITLASAALGSSSTGSAALPIAGYRPQAQPAIPAAAHRQYTAPEPARPALGWPEIGSGYP